MAKDTADDYIWPIIKKKMNVLNAVGLDQDFSINNVDTAVRKEIGQQNLNSFVSITGLKEQFDEEQKECSAMEDAASTSTYINEFKELLEIDGEYFNSCDWDDIM